MSSNEPDVGIVRPPTIAGMPAANESIYLRAVLKTVEEQRNVALATVGHIRGEYDKLSDQYRNHVSKLEMDLARATSKIAELSAANVVSKPEKADAAPPVAAKVRRGRQKLPVQ